MDSIDLSTLNPMGSLVNFFNFSTILYPYPQPQPQDPVEAFLGSLDQAGHWVTSIAGGI
ncbi:hypothetical protein G6016_03960 [Dietzia aerolata]|uniref:Uncharacterized protein n=1 Tax=Dietzia aerolata TaxID=595984 RepID=A0ABV5JQ43_9ACTN|nr:hypothetical protein [Dietzia aerolata]MBB0968129.1 hypothetical protein [Dietzia aerolata]